MFWFHKKFHTHVQSIMKAALIVASLLLTSACQSPEERIANFTENGQTLFKQEQYDLAGLEFRNALQIDPDHLPALIGLADTELKRNNPVAAAGFFQRALTLAPEDIDILLKAIRNLLRLGQLNTLDDLTTKALELAPDNADATALRGAFFMSLGQTESALDYAAQAIELEPKNLEALLVLAAERVRAGAPNEAISFIDASLTGEKSDKDLILLKINLLEQMGSYVESEQEYLNLLNIEPNNSAFRRGYALLLLKLDRKQESEAQFRAIAATNTSNIDSKLDLVRLMNTVHGQQAAEQELAAQIQLSPGYAELRFALVDLILLRGATDEAIQILRDLSLNAPDEKDQVRALAQIGRIYLTEKQYASARALVDELLKRDARNKDGLLLRAQMSINARRLEDAIGDLRTILVDDPYSTDASLALGRSHELQGNLSLAETQYAQAFRLSNANSAIGYKYRDFLLRQNELSRAEDVILAILAKNTRDRQALRALAEIRLKRQNWIGAREVSNILDELGEDDYITAQIKAAILQAEDNLPMSINVLQKAFENAPGDVKPLVSLVRAYLRAGRQDDAIAFLQQLIENEGENLQPVVLLAQLRAARGEEQDAEVLFTRAIKLGPNVLYPYRAAYIYYGGKRDYKKAREILEIGLNQANDRANIELLLAELMQREGDFDGAIALYEKLYSDHPNIPIVANNLASLLTDYKGDNPETLDRAKTIAERFKDSKVPQFRDTLGWVLYKLGDFERAFAVLKNAASLGPDLAVIHFHLGMTLKEMGDMTNARLSFDRALALEKSRPSGLATDIEKAISSL